MRTPFKMSTIGSAIAVAAAGLLAAASVGNAQVPAAEKEGIIFERQQIMEQLEKEAETLGMISAGLTPKTKLAETTRNIAKIAKESVASFEPIVPGGRAKPEVWSKRADFMKRMNDFATKSEEMAKLGEAGDMHAVTELMVEALPCKACHDAYRAPKKS